MGQAVLAAEGVKAGVKEADGLAAGGTVIMSCSFSALTLQQHNHKAHLELHVNFQSKLSRRIYTLPLFGNIDSNQSQ
uniref:hypothetical protein n=1 Tax=Pantoea sp. IMH TaxID=1267600 RepID=UPI0004695DB2|nr:hypothetical protein [Pantoea sp. IMH]